ncbi:uncharacterized protein LOC134075118 isoform X2 [Sardina pilchardus]|uniref:uncharacterized protein LOC134075118 isoform X2 n=1 Tax=Sardina pilchardus TaxID=27697 RepID=UPI002E103DD4
MKRPSKSLSQTHPHTPFSTEQWGRMKQGTAGMGGKLIFLVTFLVGYLTTGIRGNLERPTATNVSITREGCGTTKLCLGDDGCDPAGSDLCSFVSSEVVNATNSNVKFELFGNSTGYIALVLTSNVTQGGGMVFVCSRDPFNTTRNFLFRTATQDRDNGNITLTNMTSVEDISYNFNRSINGSFHQCTLTVQGLSQAINNRTTGNINVRVSLIRGEVRGGPAFAAPSAELFRTNGMVDLTSTVDPVANLDMPTATSMRITRDGCSDTKLCLGDDGCNPAGDTLCSFISARVVSASDSDVAFELFGNSTGYIALVLTSNETQGGGLVFVCSRDPFNAMRNFLFRRGTQDRDNGNITLTDSPRVVSITYNFNGSLGGSFHQCTFTVQGLSQALNRASGALNFRPSLVSGEVNADGTFDAPRTSLFRAEGILDLANIPLDPTLNLEMPRATNVSITRDGCGSTKLCLGENGCDPAGSDLCSFISSEFVNAADSNVKFELFGNSTGYIALVLSSAVNQGGGLVFVCSRDPFNNMRNFLFRTATQDRDDGNLTLTNTLSVVDITYNFNRSINGSFHQCTFTVQGLSQAINNRVSVQPSLIRGEVNADGTFAAPSNSLFRADSIVNLADPTNGATTTAAATTATTAAATTAGCSSLMHPLTQAITILVSVLALRLF